MPAPTPAVLAGAPRAPARAGREPSGSPSHVPPRLRLIGTCSGSCSPTPSCPDGWRCNRAHGPRHRVLLLRRATEQARAQQRLPVCRARRTRRHRRPPDRDRRPLAVVVHRPHHGAELHECREWALMRTSARLIRTMASRVRSACPEAERDRTAPCPCRRARAVHRRSVPADRHRLPAHDERTLHGRPSGCQRGCVLCGDPACPVRGADA